MTPEEKVIAANGMRSLRELMQATATQKPIKVTVKGWGDVHIRSLTVAEVEDQVEDIADKKDKRRIARGAARLLCDETGKRIFDPDSEEDINLLAAQPWNLLRKVLAADEDKAEDAGN